MSPRWKILTPSLAVAFVASLLLLGALWRRHPPAAAETSAAERATDVGQGPRPKAPKPGRRVRRLREPATGPASPDEAGARAPVNAKTLIERLDRDLDNLHAALAARGEPEDTFIDDAGETLDDLSDW